MGILKINVLFHSLGCKTVFWGGADGGIGIIARANNKVINGKSLNLGVGEIRLNLSLCH